MCLSYCANFVKIYYQSASGRYCSFVDTLVTAATATTGFYLSLPAAAAMMIRHFLAKLYL